MLKRGDDELQRVDAAKVAKVEGNAAEETGPSNGAGSRPAAAKRGEVAQKVYYRLDCEPLQNLPRIFQHHGADTLVEVVIPPDCMSKDNKRVKARQLWGDVTYTSDSDVVAALLHLGFYASSLSHPPPSVSSFHAVLRLAPAQQKYPSKARYVKSREWCSEKMFEGCSFQVDRCWIVTRSGRKIDLPPCIDELPAPVPTLQSLASDRTITTRTGAVKGKVSQEVSIQFNLCNEPWLKYTLGAVADKGLHPRQFTAARLHHEVLLLETASERFQLAHAQSADSSSGSEPTKELYTFSRCKHFLTLAGLQRCGMPLPDDEVDVLEAQLEWEDFTWGVSTLHVREREYFVKRMHFMPLKKA